MKVRIVQMLCPSRHCVVATAYEAHDGEAIPEMVDHLKEMFAKSGANPWCGLCQSKNLRCEDQPTRFTTMIEAAPYLAENAARQAATREYFRASRG